MDIKEMQDQINKICMRYLYCREGCPFKIGDGKYICQPDVVVDANRDRIIKIIEMYGENEVTDEEWNQIFEE